jgi:hypothetical protein
VKTAAPHSSVRFGVLCDHRQLQEWQSRCLAQLQLLPDAAPTVLLIRHPSSAGPAEKPAGLFRHLNRVSRGSPASMTELPASLAALPVIELREPPGSAAVIQLTPDSTAQIQALELDFILSFSMASVCALHALASNGVWTYEFGDWQTFRGSPPGFWEVYRNAKLTGAMLCRVTADPDAVIPLRRGSLSTRQFSYARNRDQVLTRFVHWPAQVCADILTGDLQYLSAAAIRGRPTLNTAPCNKGMLRYVIRLAWYVVSRGMLPWVEHDHWNIGIVEQPIEDFVNAQRERKPVRWLPSPAPGEFVADPFGVVREGRLTVFCEHLNYGGDAIGTIVAIQPFATAPAIPVAIGPVPRVHLSYPSVFEHDGHLLCIPETQGAREVALYGLEKFPDRWVKLTTLIADATVVDATLFSHGDLWWLAAASDPGGAQLGADLHLWYATDITGPWIPHPGNPVKTDVSSARPAGTPFYSEGVLYRPAQDSSATYGARVVINRVVALTTTTFREEPAAFVDPDPNGPYPDGLHTLSAVGNMTLVDGKRLQFAPAEFRRVLRRMVMRRVKKLF